MRSQAWVTSEALDEIQRLEKVIAENGVGLAACAAARKLRLLAETSPEVATAAGVAFELEPASEDTEGVEYSRLAWWWADRAFGLTLTADGNHPPDEDAPGYLSLYVDKELVLSLDVHRAAADGYQQIHVDQVTMFEPGDWPAQLWAFVESLSR